MKLLTAPVVYGGNVQRFCDHCGRTDIILMQWISPKQGTAITNGFADYFCPRCESSPKEKKP